MVHMGAWAALGRDDAPGQWPHGCVCSRAQTIVGMPLHMRRVLLAFGAGCKVFLGIPNGTCSIFQGLGGFLRSICSM